MLMGHVQEMIQRLAANRREAKPRSKKEKMLDLLAGERDGHPTTRPEMDPEVVERAIAEIREKARREKRRQQLIAGIVIAIVIGITVYLVWRMLHASGDFRLWNEFEIDDANRLRRSH